MGLCLRFIVRVGKKGVVVIPKKLREVLGIREGDEVLITSLGDSIILKPLRPRVVDVDSSIVEEILVEERREWDERLRRITGKTSS